MSTPSVSPNIQRWPSLRGVVPDEAATAIHLLYNGHKDHDDAIGALNTKANKAQTQATTATNQSKAVKQPSAAGVQWFTGTGSPNGVVTAPPGSLYTNLSGGANLTLYVKESGSGNTGWVAK